MVVAPLVPYELAGTGGCMCQTEQSAWTPKAVGTELGKRSFKWRRTLVQPGQPVMETEETTPTASQRPL